MYGYILALVFQLFGFVLHIYVCVGVLQTETNTSGLLNNVRITETVVLFGQMLKHSLDWTYKLANNDLVKKYIVNKFFLTQTFKNY